MVFFIDFVNYSCLLLRLVASAGLANKQNKQVLVAPTSKGAPDFRSKIIQMSDIIFKLLDSFEYYKKLLAPLVLADIKSLF